MRQVQLALPIASALVLGWPTQGTADPITVTFDVRVVERVLRTTPNPTFTTQPVNLSFALQMTFDPAQGTAESIYGSPSFSTPPLTIPTAPPGVPFSTSGATQHEVVSNPFTEPFLLAGAGRQKFFVGDHNGQNILFSEDFTLVSRTSITAPPVINPETFPLHLGMPSDAGGFTERFNFIYGSCLAIGFAGEECIDAASWREERFLGFATLRQEDGDPGVIPEPTTLVLVGSGLVLAARKRMSRRQSYRLGKG